MKILAHFILLLIIRVRNRILISIYQKPETIFIYGLVIALGIALVTLAPSMLFNFNIEMNKELFPTASYIFLISGLIPYVFFVSKGKSQDPTEGSLLRYISKDFLKHVKNIIAFFSPCILSMVTLYIILSIYKNISFFYGILYWETLVQCYFIIALTIETFIRKLLSHYITPRYETFIKQGIFLGLLTVEIGLPLHKYFGELWLSGVVPFYILVGIILVFFIFYGYINSIQINYKHINLYSENRGSWYKSISLNYVLLVIVHSKEYFIFNFLSAIFIGVISKLANNYSSLSEIYVLTFILGGTSFIFSNLTKTTPALSILRLSHIKYIAALLHFYFIVGFFSLLFYLEFISVLHQQKFIYMLKNVDFTNTLLMFYFSLYSAIVIYYLFHKFFGTIAQLFTSLFILIIAYRILPELINRIQEIQSRMGIISAYGIAIMTLLIIMLLTIGGYKNDTKVS